jgi:alkaline phosphatase D
VDRRTFLTSLAAATVAVACTTDDDASTRSSASPPTTSPEPVTAATPAPAAALAAGSFALGVASGDPLHDRVVIWTRLASAPVAVDGGSPSTDVEVAYDVATDEAFTDLVASGIATATAALAHSVHVDVTGLRPDTWYFYRFRAGDQTSPTGRTRTFPAADASPNSFRFVFASCQDFQWGRYGAWRHAAAEADLDAVLFLGDYIYETNLGDLSPDASGDRVWANGAAFTLAEYRQRYAQTKGDADLQAAHHAAPWLTIFDDHEVSNNYAGDVSQPDRDRPNSRDRRLAAYQAWYEHTPIRIEPEPTAFDDLRVHRSLQFGNLASIFAIETRQHADPPPCRSDQPEDTPILALTDDGPDCAERNDPARSNLGTDQEAWLGTGLADSTTTWNIIANPLMLAGLNVGTAEAPAYTRDTWDGYPAARDRLLDGIVTADVSNPVVVTGDWHASFVLDVKKTPESATIMPEFLATSMTTVNFSQDYRAANPHVRYFDGTHHGYGAVTVTPDELRCEFKYVGDVWDAASPIERTDAWKVAAGSHEAEPA